MSGGSPNLVPPASVAAAAAKGLGYRRRAKGRGGLSAQQAGAEGVGSGVQRAVNLKNRSKLSPSTVRRMKAFFDRHRKNKAIDPKHRDEPWKDRGYVAWLLWGGDPGYAWATKAVEQMERSKEAALSSGIPAAIRPLLPALASAAQRAYDAWDQNDEGIDEVLGAGGVCQDIAENMAGVLSSKGIEAQTISAAVGDQHVYVVAQLPDGVYTIDIPPGAYEAGAGYNWRKIPGVRFDPGYIVVDKLDDDPGKYGQYSDVWASRVTASWRDPHEAAWGVYHERYQEELERAIDNIVENRPPRKLAPLNTARMKKIWRDYAKAGVVRDERGIDDILEDFLNKVVRIDVNNYLSGHTAGDPLNEFREREIPIPKDIDDRIDTAIADIHGEWMISDYGIDYLVKWLHKAMTATDYEQKLLALDSMLNVVHQRSNLASWFVQGGRSALDELAGKEDTGRPFESRSAAGRERKVYFDLNGVLLDLDGSLKALGGERGTPEETDEFWRRVNAAPLEEWLRVTEPIPEGVRVWRALSKYDPAILSSVGVGKRWRENRESLLAKKDAIVDRHFPGAEHITVFGRDKSQYAGDGNVLIDDSPDKLRAWGAAGGIPILFKPQEAKAIIERVTSIMEGAGPSPLSVVGKYAAFWKADEVNRPWFKGYLEVFKDPTPSEFRDALKSSKYGTVRMGVSEAGDLYAWVGDAQHTDFEEKFGVGLPLKMNYNKTHSRMVFVSMLSEVGSWKRLGAPLADKLKSLIPALTGVYNAGGRPLLEYEKVPAIKEGAEATRIPCGLATAVVRSYLLDRAGSDRGGSFYRVEGDKIHIDREAVPMKVWDAFSKAMNALDYDFRGGADAKQLLSKWVTDEKGDVVLTGDHARGFLSAVGKKSLYQPTDRRRSNAVMRAAVKHFGTTGILDQAGYILPDGRLLNMGERGTRSLDHREIGLVIPDDIVPPGAEAYKFMDAFCRMGAVRMHAGRGEFMFDFRSRPTRAQIERVEDIAYAHPQGEILIESGRHRERFGPGEQDRIAPYIRKVTGF